MLEIDHIHFYVDDAERWRDWLVSVLGFASIASTSDHHTRTEVLFSGSGSLFSSNSLIFLLSSSLNIFSPVADYLRHHPSGVADVAFRVSDLDSILSQSPHLNLPVQQWQSEQGHLRWTKIISAGNIQHTLIERKGITPIFPEIILKPEPRLLSRNHTQFLGIDHIVLNVGMGELEKTIFWYEEILGFKREQTFTIATEQSGLYSQVMVHPTTEIKIPINEPLSLNSQIQEFIILNKGSGVQHIALKTSEIISLTQQLRKAGLQFLTVPDQYYSSLDKRIIKPNLSDSEWQQICQQKILIDYESNNSLQPLLLQIFTQPIFEKPTFFLELIERRHQMQGFGERNFQALFEAMESEQAKRGTL